MAVKLLLKRDPKCFGSLINEIVNIAIDPEAFDRTHEWEFEDISEIDPVVDALFDETKIIRL